MDLRHGMRFDDHVREYRIVGGNARLRRDAAFELGRIHRTRDSKGPRGRLAVFEDIQLTQAYVAGYNSPYWWERGHGNWQDYHPGSRRLALYRYWRAYGLPAKQAWELVRGES